MHADGARGSGSRRSSDELWADLVAEIAVMPDVVANLLREHRPDEHGYCLGNGCGTAGRGVPTIRWPCSLHKIASQAKGVRAARRASEEPTAPGSPPAEERAEPPRPPLGPAVTWVLYGRRPIPGAPPTSATDS